MANVCSSQSPWNGTSEVVHATLGLHIRGIEVGGLSDDEVIRLYRETIYPMLPDEYEIRVGEPLVTLSRKEIG